MSNCNATDDVAFQLEGIDHPASCKDVLTFRICRQQWPSGEIIKIQNAYVRLNHTIKIQALNWYSLVMTQTLKYILLKKDLHFSFLFLCILNLEYLWNLGTCSDQAQIFRECFLYQLLLSVWKTGSFERWNYFCSKTIFLPKNAK